MQIVIDIPEDTKNRLCFGITYQKDIQTICEALNDGTPIPDNATVCDVEQSAILLRKLYEEYEHTLEQIRAEIYKKSVQMHFDGNFYIKMDEVLQIIDKYTKGESE